MLRYFGKSLYSACPDGSTLGYGQNSMNGANGTSLSAYTLQPVPGRWTLVLDIAEPVAGNEISQPFTGKILFNDVSAWASGLPNSINTKLAAGVPVKVPITVTNNGVAPEAFFVDARLNTMQQLPLTAAWQ